MLFIDLNIDVTVEIFRQCLCIDSNGQITLMLVCSTWKEIVTNTPSLWNYIKVDQNKSGWETQFAIASSLSKSLPLTIILLYPFPAISFLEPYVDLIESLIIELRGAFYAERTFEMVSHRFDTLGGYRGHVGWINSDTAFYFAPNVLYDKMRQVNDASERELLHSYLSGIRAVLITDLTLIGEPTKKVSLKTIWYCISLLPNLTRLRLAGDCIASPSGSNPPTLRLRHLQELHLLAGSGGISDISALSLVISRIHSVALQYILLKGPSDLVADLITLLDYTPVLNQLYVHFTAFSSTPSTVHRDGLGTKHHWPIKLTIDLAEIKSPSLLDTITCMQPLLARTELRAPCNFIVNSLPVGIKEAQQIIGYPIALSYNGKGPSSSNFGEIYFHRKNADYPLPLTEVTFKSETVDHDRPDILLHLTKRLHYRSYDNRGVIRSPNIWDSNRGVIHLPNLWGPEIEEISTEMGTFAHYITMNNSHVFLPSTRSFMWLTTISSLPEVAIILITSKSIPKLQRLTLNQSGSDSQDMANFTALSKAIMSTEHGRIACPKLHTLAVKYFPPWPAILILVQKIAKHRQDDSFVVKLPSLPHQSILQYLVQSIPGQYKHVVDLQLDGIPNWETYENAGKSLAPGCFLCHCSGWTCKSRQTCLRHSLEHLTLITRDSA